MSLKDTLRDYQRSIQESLRQGNATEHTYRPALKALIEQLALNIGKGAVHAINEPKRVACGAPDFIIADGTLPLGYVETKDVGEDLRRVEKSDQLKRYRDALTNLVLTDYIKFRWYVDGELALEAALPSPSPDGRIRADENASSQVAQLLQQFLIKDIQIGLTPQDLATRMAGMARLIRQLIEETFKQEASHGELHIQLAAFRKVLIESLTEEQFADMYAQTLCYGLFAARCNEADGQGFTRQSAASAIPKTNPFLRKLFNSIAGPDLDERIAWAVDQLAVLLARANMTEILRDFGRHTRREDPVVHFYETFLAAYNPQLRETRGVYYTPEPVVSYIVRSVDELLKREFKMPDGLADSSKVTLKRPEGNGKKAEKYDTHKLQILDPATGTGTFLYAVIAKIREHFDGNEGAWPGYVAEHLLPRIFGFELLMAPYAVAHMKLGLQLQETGYDFGSDQRLGVFLTNSLEEAHEMTGLPLFTQWLAEESRSANEIKRDAPVMVVLGNPPYSGHSLNKGEWIEKLMMDYKRSPQLKKPAQAKWLSDDYVKFIRFAQWRIEQTGFGILAFITNHSYLDNPTFMDMRESLLKTFDSLYIYDLHGSAKRQEKAPDGGKDENVFDIQQGVSLGIFIKNNSGGKVKDSGKPKVYRSDLWGDREAKYSRLNADSLATTKWRKLDPKAPQFLFVEQDTGLLLEYELGYPLPQILGANGDPAPGIVTTHDGFAISWSREEAIHKVEQLLATDVEAEARGIFKLCSQDQWKYSRAKSELASGKWRQQVVKVLYRPFDVRWVVYNRNVAVHRRERVSDHFYKRRNIGLVVSRQRSVASRDWENAFVTTHLIESCAISNKTKEINYLFPLHLYPREKRDMLESATEQTGTNLSQEFLDELRAGQSPDERKEIEDEEILSYIYAILYSPTYRTRYADFLKRDFPRIPFTSSHELFAGLAELGQELVELHTMERTLGRITQYPVTGSNVVDRVGFVTESDTDKAGRVFINDGQFFGDVPVSVWNMHIGGYRVAEKWLKDRKGRELSYDDITHYQAVIAALARTLEIQREIDAKIDGAGGWPLQ